MSWPHAWNTKTLQKVRSIELFTLVHTLKNITVKVCYCDSIVRP